ncbi:hypothetical protein HGG82_02185 [Marinomonas sp. M1K-6]|uniref:Cytochrome b562 n=1 Tax=Marinomonas profundi TaxID=2726122 RepID=A0A847QZH7_9GAMM|nr:cytochrome b562 [Marinomonas profundi]NLQ16431.1 hypothetical protein [Marinomonas profundi]UDV02996.1 hypothetical protein J8N69_15810 [Marinomonas profundi]
MNKGFIAAAILSLSCSSAVFANQSCDESPLRGYMGNIANEMRSMSTDIKSGDHDAAAQRVETLITYFEKAQGETPYKFKVENLQGESLAVQQAKYEKVVDDTIAVLENLEGALQSGSSSDVRKWLGEIGVQRNIGHGAFRVNC